MTTLLRFHNGQERSRFIEHDRLHPGEDVALNSIGEMLDCGKAASRGHLPLFGDPRAARGFLGVALRGRDEGRLVWVRRVGDRTE